MENNEVQKSKNMIECKTCGQLIAKTAKKCPNCGAKNKKPIYKRVWFIILGIIVIIIIIGCIAGGGDDTATTDNSGNKTQAEATEPSIEYTSCDVGTLNDALEENAVNAKDLYNEQYLELTGELSTIDSDGSYFNLVDPNDEWDFVGVTCRITDDSQLDAIKKHSKGDTITIKGQVTDVGEIIGYSFSVDSIE